MTQEISSDDLEICLGVLQRIADSHGTIRRGDRFNSLVSKVYREGKKHDLHAERRRQEGEDRSLKATTVMVQLQRDALPAVAALLPAGTGVARLLNQPETCYTCKQDFLEVHFFYHLLC